MAVRNLDGIFQPRSIVVVGPERIGAVALDLFFTNLGRAGYKGKIHFVGLTPPDGLAATTSASLSVFDEKVDLAVVLSGGASAAHE